jgi:hypothetical protein
MAWEPEPASSTLQCDNDPWIAVAEFPVNDGMESKADRYRRRAEELRAIASQIMDLTARATLIEVAEDYERMAFAAENSAIADGAPANHKKAPR